MRWEIGVCTSNDNDALRQRIYAGDDEMRIKRKVRLPVLAYVSILPSMFMVSEEAAAGYVRFWQRDRPEIGCGSKSHGWLADTVKLDLLFP
jgi:hypothetical protein